MYKEIETPKSIEEVEQLLPEVIKEHGFGILGIHDLRRSLMQKGVDFREECLVYEICNPQKAKVALEHNLAMASVLPCRIAVYRKRGKTILSTIYPSILLDNYYYLGLREMAKDLEKDIFEIMDDAAQWHVVKNEQHSEIQGNAA